MSKRKSLFKASLAWLTMAFLVISMPGLGSFAQASQSATVLGSELFHMSGTLTPNESIAPSYSVFSGTDQHVNLKLHATEVAGSGVISVTITNSAGQAFAEAILDGETLWTPLTLKPGSNTITLHNTSLVTVDFEL
jgi:hypothetical protein